MDPLITSPPPTKEKVCVERVRDEKWYYLQQELQEDKVPQDMELGL